MTPTKLLLAAALFTLPLHAEENWPQFRGPNGDGHSDAKSLPLKLGEGVNVKWKTATHGKAWSSPVIWGNEVWLTTATEDGKELGVMAFDKATGKVMHDKVLFKVEKPQFCHKFNSHASPTPVIEDGRLYASWGSPATACIDTKTCAVVWERRDFVCNHYRGSGSSPVVWNGLLFNHYDGSDHQFIVALDKKTGKTVWEVKRSVDYKDLTPDGKVQADGDWRKAYATPHVVEWQGKPLLLSSGAKAHYAYEPATGKEVWRFDEHGSHSAAARPVVGGGLVIFPTGFGKKQIVALKLGGSGALDESSVAWRETKGAPNKPSLILDGNYVYAVDDKGIATCFEAKTGAVKWTERIGGDYSASPLLAAGRLYFFSESGTVTIVAAAPEFKKLGEGKFDDGFMAAPAASGKALFLRTRTALYRVEE